MPAAEALADSMIPVRVDAENSLYKIDLIAIWQT